MANIIIEQPYYDVDATTNIGSGGLGILFTIRQDTPGTIDDAVVQAIYDVINNLPQVLSINVIKSEDVITDVTPA